LSDAVRIGVSACLLGQRVRYDGAHKEDPFLTGTVADLVTLVPVCPEVELGLGTPRETIHRVRGRGGVRLVGTQSGADHTAAMRRHARARVRALAALGLDGFVLKKDSPSCGLERVRLRGPDGAVAREGSGLFAEALLAGIPQLPVEEEGRLRDPRRREGFFVRVFAYRRLRALWARPRWRLGDLVRFHTAEKLLLLAHDRAGHRELGRLVACARDVSRGALRRRYSDGFMTTLGRRATRRKHTDVLQRAQGHLERLLAADARRALAEAIEDYRLERAPLIVPLTLLRHHVRAHGVEDLAGQSYLEPHPTELALRFHA